MDSSANWAWTAFRLHGIRDGEVHGLSHGFVVPGQNGGSLYWDYTPTFLASVDDLTELYEIQVGRDGSGSAITLEQTSGDVDGIDPPFMVCVIRYLGTADWLTDNCLF